MELRDKKEIKMGFKLPLKTGRNRIRQSLTGARGFSKLNIREVCQLHLYLTKPASEQVYYLGICHQRLTHCPNGLMCIANGIFADSRKLKNVCGRH